MRPCCSFNQRRANCNRRCPISISFCHSVNPTRTPRNHLRLFGNDSRNPCDPLRYARTRSSFLRDQRRRTRHHAGHSRDRFRLSRNQLRYLGNDLRRSRDHFRCRRARCSFSTDRPHTPTLTLHAPTDNRRGRAVEWLPPTVTSPPSANTLPPSTIIW